MGTCCSFVLGSVVVVVIAAATLDEADEDDSLVMGISLSYDDIRVRSLSLETVGYNGNLHLIAPESSPP